MTRSGGAGRRGVGTAGGGYEPGRSVRSASDELEYLLLARLERFVALLADPAVRAVQARHGCWHPSAAAVAIPGLRSVRTARRGERDRLRGGPDPRWPVFRRPVSPPGLIAGGADWPARDGRAGRARCGGRQKPYAPAIDPVS